MQKLAERLALGVGLPEDGAPAASKHSTSLQGDLLAPQLHEPLVLIALSLSLAAGLRDS